MSPEQVRGEAIDGRSDLFGLGCVLYALCTGHPPFRAETSYAVLRRITDTEPRPIRETNPNVPLWLEQIVMKLLAKSADNRFDSAAEVAELLEDCLAHVQQPTTTPLPAGVQALAASSMAPARNRLKAIHQHIPPIGKLIAAAAFAFSLIFAGVLIVLELNKGTLTIESEADDVPIRIMQGDDVVEKLTVTKSGRSVRIAAGTYTIEVDGDFEGISLKDNIVSLKRRGTETIRIVRDVKSVEIGGAEVNTELHAPLNGPYNFEILPVRIAKWSETKDGLRIGIRVVGGDWSIGGKVRIEMWLHNASTKDISFKANPGRADVGLMVWAVDSEGNEHRAENGNITILAIPMLCTLPADFVAKVKDFELSFDAPNNKDAVMVAAEVP